MIYNTEVVVFLEMAKFQEKKGERKANYILLEELTEFSFLFIPVICWQEASTVQC